MPKRSPRASAPWHEWRENVREIAIVAAGVFIALVAPRAEIGALIDRYWVDDRTYDHIALDAAQTANVGSSSLSRTFS